MPRRALHLRLPPLPSPRTQPLRLPPRRIQTLLIATLVLTVTPSVAKAQTSAPHHHKELFKHQVEQLEETWRTAQMNDDVAGMDKLLSEDYVGITMSGQVVTKEQQLDRMRNRTLQLTKITLEDVKVKLIGSTAVVTSLAEIDGTNDGVPMHGTYRYTRVYSRLPSGSWQITNFEATRVGPPPPPPDGKRPHPRESKESSSRESIAPNVN